MCEAEIVVVEVAAADLCVPWVACLGLDGRHLLIARDVCDVRQILDGMAVLQAECDAAEGVCTAPVPAA